MINSIKELLADDYGSNQLVQIYNCNDDSDVFNLGQFISVSNDSYVYVSIDKKGFMDGIRFGYISDIYKISKKGKYIDKYKKIFQLFDRRIDLHEYTSFFKNDDCDLLSFFKFAYDNNKIISLSLCNSNQYDVSGLISSYNDKTLVLNEINTYGEEEETSIIDIQNIDFCSCDSEDEKILKSLYNYINNDQ